MQTFKWIVTLLVVLVTACGTTATEQYTTTGATCMSNSTACRFQSDCCSQWCVNGSCEQRQP